MTLRVVVIGAGVGGLTTAAILTRAGLDVTVLEAHIYPGGSAGTFFHQGYRFDAGATLAGGFYPGGPMDRVAQAAGIPEWPARAIDPAMVVHLPDGRCLNRWTGERRWEERLRFFGADSEPFWRWQEATADALWSFALRTPSFPPQSISELLALAGTTGAWALDSQVLKSIPGLAADALRPTASRLPPSNNPLRQFIDGQLLISAQTTSAHANALFSAAALDLPRRGVVHLRGGMGGIANTLVEAIRSHGGKVLFRKEVVEIASPNKGTTEVVTKWKERFPADLVIANLPPWNLQSLLNGALPKKIRDLPEIPEDGWGAFIAYVGFDESALPDGIPLHHQVLAEEPLSEGNSIFLSISPEWDEKRAPSGQRAATISTHTSLKPWWSLFQNDRTAYEEKKAIYTARLLKNAELAVPGLGAAARLVLPGTPVTFQRFTRRKWGWVGGFPQTNLFRTWGPRLSSHLWMVGDSIFPGQSTAAVALGGMRVARSILGEVSKGSTG